MTLVKGQGCLALRSQASEVFIGPSSNKSNNEDYTNPLGSNKPEPSKAPTGPEALAGPPWALLSVFQDFSVN